MMRAVEVVPTVVPDSFDDVVRIAEACHPFARRIHIDVADGVFEPNTTWMPEDGDQLPDTMEFEIHLMVADPHEVGLSYARAGATGLIGHVEAFGEAAQAKAAFDAWREAGIHTVATAALLQTKLEIVSPFVEFSDFVLLMTIASIGVQGIPFEENSIERISAFNGMHPEATIGVDGGVSEKNIEILAKAGATHFCVGSAISKAEDPATMYEHLTSLAKVSAL